MANPGQASGSRSIIEELNAHRERRPVSSAMEELNRTLDGLERRLSQMERAPAEAPRFFDPPQDDVAAVRDEMLRLQRQGAADSGAERFAQRMSDDIDRIGESVRMLAERSGDAGAMAMRRQFEDFNLALHSLAREDTLRQIDERLDALERRPADPALDAIGERLEDMREAMRALPQSTALGMIEARLDHLAETVAQSRSAPADHEALGQIDERLDEISRAIIAASRAQRPDPEEARRLDRIENHLGELAGQILAAASPAKDNHEALVRKLGELSQRLDALAAQPRASDRIVEQLAQQINLLATQVGKVMDGLSHADSRSVEARLDAIAEKLESVQRRAAQPHPAVLDTIDRRFAELTERLDAHHAESRPDTAFHALEGRLEDLSQQISLGLLQAPAAPAPSLADSAALRSLEDQIAGIARHLAQPAAELAGLKPRLDSIERSIATNRETVLDAAREAAESAVARVLKHGSESENAIARQLAGDIRSLEALARSADERNGRTFEAVHETLGRIVDRLTALEKDMGGKAARAEDEPRFAVPRAEPRRDAARSPAAAAAEAAIATVQSESAAGGAEPAAKASLFGGLGKALRGRRAEDPVRTETPDEPMAVLDDAPEPLGALKPARQEPALDAQPESAPDLHAIMKRVREERRERDGEGDLTEAGAEAGVGKVDFITAARRAAQLAAAEAEQAQKGAKKRAGGKKSSMGDLVQRQRKPILLGVGAVLIAIAGLQVGSLLLNRPEPADLTLTPAPKAKAVDEKPAQDAAPQTAEAPAQQAAPVTPVTAEAPATESPAAQPQAVAEVKPETPAAEPAATTAPEASAPKAEAPQQADVQPAAPAPQAAQAPAETAPAAAETKPVPAAAIPAIPAEAGPAALREAAAKGDARALFEIGNRYMEGRGVPADFQKAAKWYDVAAAQGFAPAQYRLGNFNEKGLGMPRNLEKAKTWYQLAAQQGNASAMHNLAVLFATGADGAPDNVSAVRWFTDAAELGVKDSQFNLGILAAKGVGMPVNLEDSYKWFALAANAGDKDAADKRDQIAKALKPEQLERAKGAVTLWKAKPLNQAANAIDVPDAWTDAKPLSTGSVDMKKAVRNIQLILKKNGFYAGAPDGVMGAQTRKSIAAFQTAHGQKPTGEVDQKLVQALLEKNK